MYADRIGFLLLMVCFAMLGPIIPLFENEASVWIAMLIKGLGSGYVILLLLCCCINIGCTTLLWTNATLAEYARRANESTRGTGRIARIQ